MERLYKKTICFPLLILFIFLRVPAFASVYSITDFSTYEYVKKNFTYSEQGGLINLADTPVAPVAKISFQIPKNNPPLSHALTWERGISGIAPRFFGVDSNLVLPGWKDFFAAQNLKGFTLSFYFFPETIAHEEILFEAKPQLTLQQNSLSPHFKVALQAGYFSWELNEFFFLGKNNFSKQLKSKLPFRHGEWNYAVIGYDEFNNRLVMFLNGEMVDFVYATPDGKRHSARYQMGFIKSGSGVKATKATWFVGKNTANSDYAEMMLGKSFTGRIDEIELYDVFLANLPTRYQLGEGVGAKTKKTFKTFDSGLISTTASEEDSPNLPPPYRAVFASKVFRLEKNLRLTLANITGTIADARLVKLYFCSSKEYFMELPSFSSCNPIILNSQIIDYPPGEFYQFFIIYDQLEHASKTVNGMQLTFAEDDIPLPPRWVKITQAKEGIMLQWKETLESIAGYRIYYSLENLNTDKRMVELSVEELGIYKTPEALWTYVLEGLETDRQYMFMITSFDYRGGKVRESSPSRVESFFYSSNFFN